MPNQKDRAKESFLTTSLKYAGVIVVGGTLGYFAPSIVEQARDYLSPSEQLEITRTSANHFAQAAVAGVGKAILQSTTTLIGIVISPIGLYVYRNQKPSELEEVKKPTTPNFDAHRWLNENPAK